MSNIVIIAIVAAIAIFAVYHFHFLPKIEALFKKHLPVATVGTALQSASALQTPAAPISGSGGNVVVNVHSAPPAATAITGIDANDAVGAVAFSGAPTRYASERFLFMGALSGVAAGSQQYANIVWNCAVGKTEEAMGALVAIGKQMIASPDPLTGAASYKPGPPISPPVLVIPAEYATVQAALGYLKTLDARLSAGGGAGGNGGFSPFGPK